MGDIEHPAGRAEGEATCETVLLRTVTRLAEIPAAEWNACARGAEPIASDPARLSNPFISHAFLGALEDSGSATRETGWLPQHLLLEDQSGALLACMPCYLKSHRQGEYVFDHGWADAYLRAGGRYYPKLQASVPFTPVTGKRLLVRASDNTREREALLLQAAVQVADRLGVSSLHVTFPTHDEWQLAGKMACFNAPTSNSTGRTRVTGALTISWRASPRASARRSAKSAVRRLRTASRSNG
jgi:predicted N-acyltransferase